MNTRDVEIVRSALTPLCADLHEIFSTSVDAVRKTRIRLGIDADVYNSAGADLTRALVHREIVERQGLEDWSLAGKHNLRGQIMLRRGNVMNLRFLHDAKGRVPGAGTNSARRAYYRNLPVRQASIWDAKASGLLAVWRVTDPELASVEFRIVRPVSANGTYFVGDTEVDLDFILPNSGPDLSSLEFEQVDEGLSLELPADEALERDGELRVLNDDVG